MNHIKKFIDQVSFLESRPGKDLVMPANEARMLRDEICKLLVDRVSSKPINQPTSSVMITGGSFK